ncbi:MAG: GrpB family protein, partial [Pseudomonadota bacterium]
MSGDPTDGHYKAIQVVDYDSVWPIEFDSIKAKLGRCLNGIVADIAHIGSTAVPGLSAKPKIDVDIVLSSKELIPQ